jgi:hypothetical protein
MQHLLKVVSYEATRLISIAGINSNKTLLRFRLGASLQIDSRRGVASGHPVMGFCIDGFRRRDSRNAAHFGPSQANCPAFCGDV